MKKLVYNYGYDEYVNDIKSLYKRLSFKKKEIQLVGIFKGSLPIVTHLGNLLNVPVSIVECQTRDKHKKKVVRWAINNIDPKKTIVLIDDIFDTGKTVDLVMNFLNKEHKKKKINISNSMFITLFGPEYINPNGVVSLRKHLGRWIVFHWERI